MKERATTSCWSGRRPLVREAEEAGEEGVDGLVVSGFGSQQERGRGGVMVHAEEEGAGVGAPTAEESSDSPWP